MHNRHYEEAPWRQDKNLTILPIFAIFDVGFLETAYRLKAAFSLAVIVGKQKTCD